jgi:hypothetical protein
MPATVTPLSDGTSCIEIDFRGGQGAAMIFFGVE